tara:strand:+ start:6126 stop:6752 length:627 start_codon:yes stop_codon:yes gene_type:complete
MKKSILVIAILVFAFASNAQNSEKEFAQYGVFVGVSPFGMGANFNYNFNEKTTLSIGLGFAPEGEVPSALAPEVSALGDYTWESKTQWMGMFVNHRPFESMNWFTVNAGIGIGYIENHIHIGHEVLPEGHSETDAEYHANYSENPVGYFGFAARTPNQKGLQFGFDFGLLHTGGPVISGIDESKVAAIKDNLAPNVLPNFQISVGYGF